MLFVMPDLIRHLLQNGVINGPNLARLGVPSPPLNLFLRRRGGMNSRPRIMHVQRFVSS